MKKTLLFLILAVSFLSEASAQTPRVVSSFTGTGPWYFAKKDTVLAGATDTVWAEINPLRNSLEYEFDVTRLAGRSDSVSITLYGTGKPFASITGYVTIAAFSNNLITNSDGLQMIGECLAERTIGGNPYQNYMVVIQNKNLTPGSKISWMPSYFTR